MVPVDGDNPYALRAFLLERAFEACKADPYKDALLKHLGLQQETSQVATTQHYKRCALLAFSEALEPEERQMLDVLTGQAHQIDGTPSPWVSDIWIVWGIHLAVQKAADTQLQGKCERWIKEFLPQRLKSGRLDPHEAALANFILGNPVASTAAPVIALFLHYRDLLAIHEAETKSKCVMAFSQMFRDAYSQDLPGPLLAVMVYVFDELNKETAFLPPNHWSLDDVVRYLENIPVGLRRWTWENKPRTANGQATKWQIQNEYHVQNLLYVLLAPIFHDITDENYTAPVGQKNPRIDLHLPSINTIIEVKFRKNSSQSFQALIGEVAEDASLYRADPRFKNCNLVIFLWDCTRATEQHPKFKEGALKISGIDACVVISSPSVMDSWFRD